MGELRKRNGFTNLSTSYSSSNGYVGELATAQQLVGTGLNLYLKDSTYWYKYRGVSWGYQTNARTSIEYAEKIVVGPQDTDRVTPDSQIGAIVNGSSSHFVVMGFDGNYKVYDSNYRLANAGRIVLTAGNTIRLISSLDNTSIKVLHKSSATNISIRTFNTSSLTFGSATVLITDVGRLMNGLMQCQTKLVQQS
jgi:hypothetical protein